jgi:hypothetical protein
LNLVVIKLPIIFYLLIDRSLLAPHHRLQAIKYYLYFNLIRIS